jgi:hypothetical protein
MIIDHTQLLGAIKSSNMESDTSPDTINLDTKGAFVSNTDLTPLVSNTGSSYTAQNNIKVSTLPNTVETYDISDTHFDYVSTVKKPYHISTFNIASTATAGTLLKTINIPSDYFAANHVLQNVGNTFRSFAGKFHILISVQGSPSYSGAMIANAKYGRGTLNYSTATTAYQNMNYMQKVILDYSDNSSTADLVVPFRFNRTGIDPFLTAHTIQFRAYAPLGGATSISATVSIFVEEPVFRFLRPQTSTFLTTTEFSQRETQGLLNITTINNTMRDIADSTLPMNLKGDSLDLNPSLMDAVPIALNSSPLIVKYNSFNNADNPFAVDRMSMVASAQRISDDTTFGTTQDEMDIKEITKRDNYVTSFDLTTTTAVNSAVFATFVTPTRLWANNATATPIEVVTNNFKYWRGGLKYKFRFFMNRFQSMKLYASMFYKDTEPTVLTDWSASHGVVLDIGGDQREVEIEVPYNAETSWLYVPYKAPQDLTTETHQKFALGKIALYAITPLISPTGSPTNVRCVVTVSSADDFELATYQPVSNRAQGIILSERSIRKPNDIVDSSPSLKTLLKRYYGFTNSLSTVNLDKNYAMCDIIYPGNFWGFTGSANDTVESNEVFMKFPFNSRIPVTRLYEGYRGGMTLRVAMTYAPQKDTTVIGSDLVPFCLFLPKSRIDTATTTFMADLCGSVNKYFNAPYSSDLTSVNTPYVSMPINSIGEARPGQEIVFEIDCPYQDVEKYSLLAVPNSPQTSHGFVLAGFWNPHRQGYGEAKDYVFTIRTSIKFSDDGRLGLLEVGSHDSSSISDSWSSSI